MDALSIDIDSFDCAVLREVLRVVSPKMVSVAERKQAAFDDQLHAVTTGFSFFFFLNHVARLLLATF